jgi:phage host-nuclease inhibitor protein Gam
MKLLTINSVEGLETAVADVVRLKIERTRAMAVKDAAVAEVEKEHQERLTDLAEEIAEFEGRVQDYCTANRALLFQVNKSREINLAIFGFELTPHRVETTSRKITWKDVVARLSRLAWGKAYVRQPAPLPDKQALLTDREKLSPGQCTAAGIAFAQDEQFFIRPKPETAAETIKEAA